MHATRDIATDLITPLGAYLRLRSTARAAFLLESVERGRLGRHSFVGCGTRLCSFDEAEACGAPVVGYLAYDYAATLEPTVQLPADGSGLPESRFLVADTLVRFDHALGTAEVVCGDPADVARALESPEPRRSTSARVTRSRSSSRSARNGRRRPPRSSSTAHCVA